ncbi:mariner Mos1 transposase [Trichonephila clavipes]|nr:mariner Mos1 transposase [Trichonephila clavipes]
MNPVVSDTILKRNDQAWKGVLLHHLVGKKARAENSRIKTMLITFFDSQGIIHKEFLPEGKMMNAARHVEILIRFMKRLRRVRPRYAQQVPWFCVYDNARPHTANIVK